MVFQYLVGFKLNILILDFNDSFTYNIYNEFLSLSTHVKVLHIDMFSLSDTTSYDLIVLGPGPGKYTEYERYFKTIESLVFYSNLKEFHLLGICLGHQLIQNSLGREIFKLKAPVHGQSQSVKFSNDTVLIPELNDLTCDVQFYNSWAVRINSNHSIFEYELQDDQGSLIASFSKNITTYQFHPESVGTSCPKAFFKQCLV